MGMKFEIIGELRSVEAIAAGRQIRPAEDRGTDKTAKGGRDNRSLSHS